jgi:hypothetical protein
MGDSAEIQVNIGFDPEGRITQVDGKDSHGHLFTILGPLPPRPMVVADKICPPVPIRASIMNGELVAFERIPDEDQP